MSQALYTDQETGSEIREADGGSYQVVDGDGQEIALVTPDEADEISTLMADLADPETSAQGAAAPTGDGWVLGQISHALFGPVGLVFYNPDDKEEAAEFRGRVELAEAFADVFSG